MCVAESEHVLIWKHALLEITFLSFPCQHKYLSKPVSGALSLLVLTWRKEKARESKNEKRDRERKIKAPE